MFYQTKSNNTCGCEMGYPVAIPSYQQCNQVVQTCNVEDIPHYTNYHTHGNSNSGYIKDSFINSNSF